MTTRRNYSTCKTMKSIVRQTQAQPKKHNLREDNKLRVLMFENKPSNSNRSNPTSLITLIISSKQSNSMKRGRENPQQTWNNITKSIEHEKSSQVFYTSFNLNFSYFVRISNNPTKSRTTQLIRSNIA